MDKTKKEMYEVFIDSLEKSRTKEGKLLFDKLFEDVWIFVDKKLSEALILPVVVKPLNAFFKIGDKVKFARRKCVVKFFNEKSKLYDLEEEETEKGYFNVPLWFITKSV